MFYKVYPNIPIDHKKIFTVCVVEMFFISCSETLHDNPNIPLELFYPIFRRLQKRAKSKSFFDYSYAVYYAKRVWMQFIKECEKTSIGMNPSIGKIEHEKFNLLLESADGQKLVFNISKLICNKKDNFLLYKKIDNFILKKKRSFLEKKDAKRYKRIRKR